MTQSQWNFLVEGDEADWDVRRALGASISAHFLFKGPNLSQIGLIKEGKCFRYVSTRVVAYFH